ncbi:MAG: polysaccharide deacetylase family protein [Paraclostridium sp.]
MKIRIKKIKAFLSSIAFFATTLFSLFILVYVVKYIGTNIGNDKMPIHKVETEDKKVAISFDVAWGASNIDGILETLEKNQVKSTFFLVGSWIDNNKDLVKKINDKGHDIGNHSNTHANMKELSEEALINELEITSEKIQNITGEKPSIYRPPFGAVDKDSLSTCEALGYKVVKWDVDSLDWKQIGPNHIIDNVLKDIEPGSIVLFHGNAFDSSQYLETIIKEIKSKGYEIVTVSELVYEENYEVDANGVQKLKLN